MWLIAMKGYPWGTSTICDITKGEIPRAESFISLFLKNGASKRSKRWTSSAFLCSLLRGSEVKGISCEFQFLSNDEQKVVGQFRPSLHRHTSFILTYVLLNSNFSICCTVTLVCVHNTGLLKSTQVHHCSSLSFQPQLSPLVISRLTWLHQHEILL